MDVDGQILCLSMIFVSGDTSLAIFSMTAQRPAVMEAFLTHGLIGASFFACTSMTSIVRCFLLGDYYISCFEGLLCISRV